MSSQQLSSVKGFKIWNQFGSIEWNVEVDLSSAALLDRLDQIVNIQKGCVSVYENEEGAVDGTLEAKSVPTQGRELNKPATITLQGISQKSSDLIRFEKRLLKVCNQRGAIFKSYSPKTEEWIFSVNNFSD